MLRPASQSLTTILAAIVWLSGDPALADDSPRSDRAPTVDFAKAILPILRKHCFECHGSDVQEGDLRLDVKKRALAGGESGEAILPRKAKQSLLVRLISGEDEDGRVMPPEEEAAPLSKKQIALIRAWVNEGAVWPDGLDHEAEQQADLWSFEPVIRPVVPDVDRIEWVRNPIDAFVLAKLESAGIEPAAPAGPRALIRRAWFDLIGLPPSAAEAERSATALADRPDEPTFENVIDRLLASPHYGERWARHWLDLVRYADSNGYEGDGEKPMAWKYRDYVIRAFNDDTPYDRFVLEQLAGDELDDASSETIIATGFYRVGPWDAERGASVQPSEMLAERYNELDDMVSTTSQVFLGLTLGCARCHDHKFDPLTTRDYYNITAIFGPLTRHRNGRTELTRPAIPHREMSEKQQADKRITDLAQRIKKLCEPLRIGLLTSAKTDLPADAVAAFNTPEEKRNDQQKELAKKHSGQLDELVADALRSRNVVTRFLSADVVQEIAGAQREASELKRLFDYPQGYFLYEPSPKPPVAHLLKRGNPNQPGPVVEPAVPAAIVERQPSFDEPDEFTSRRRISLARWIADVENPLTARVIVNRVWQYHFGRGLVSTPSDFGRRGTPPTHPELLDWLADWFVRDADWSLKRLHRLIMTSSTYRMSKQFNAAGAMSDPANRLLWRFPYRRLEVEAIRDSMLVASGRLNAQLYGPSMYPQIPDESRRSGYDPKGVWKDFNEADASRRTIYAYLKRTLVVPFLDTLDFCDTTRSADRRDITIVAPQALELLNGQFSNRQAQHFADRLIREAGDDVEQQIELAYRLALGRAANSEERLTLSELWNRERAEAVDEEKTTDDEARRQALVKICRVIFNLNEFVYAD